MAKKGQVQASKMQKQDKSRTYKGYELKILFAIIKIRKLTETSVNDKIRMYKKWNIKMYKIVHS